jgi:hypothetical protein
MPLLAATPRTQRRHSSAYQLDASSKNNRTLAASAAAESSVLKMCI